MSAPTDGNRRAVGNSKRDSTVLPIADELLCSGEYYGRPPGLAGLPEDMRSRFVRVAELIEAVDLPNGSRMQTCSRFDLGNPAEGQGGYRPRALRNGQRQARRGRPRLGEEDAEDAEQFEIEIAIARAKELEK
jgi:hypothetical protein